MDEALTKIKFALKVLENFKDDFEAKRTNLKEYFKDKEVVPWEFASGLVFPRYNCFISRVQQLQVGDMGVTGDMGDMGVSVGVMWVLQVWVL